MPLKFKDKYYLTLEHGKWSTVNKGMVYQLQGATWNEVYRHPEWDLLLNLHVHNDGYLYATGGKIGGSGGAVRTADGTTWEKYYYPANHWLWDMASSDYDLWFSGAYGGDYGDGCHPAVFKNKARVWDSTVQGAGYLGIAVYKSNVFFGQANPAKVIRFEDKKTVLDRPGMTKVTKMVVDESTDILYAFFCGADAATSGAEVWSTVDGETWKQVGASLAIPHIFNAFYEPTAKEIWIAGGKWSQGTGGYGQIYKSARQ